MCRSIKVLRRAEGVPPDDELYLAARQFIRKVSGFQKPSKANQAAFDRAVEAVTEVSRQLFAELKVEPARRTPRAEGEEEKSPQPPAIHPAAQRRPGKAEKPTA